jgi:hypothetical protein
MGESDRIRDAGFERYHRISELRTPHDNAEALSKFLSISSEQALEIAHTNHLFED